MPFDWPDYLKVAREVSTQSTEGHWRAAVSRAYYAAYHAAKDFVEVTTGVECRAPIGTGSHEYVWLQVDELITRYKIISDAGIEGDRLRIQRTVADYEKSSRIVGTDARKAIHRASNIISQLSNPASRLGR